MRIGWLPPSGEDTAAGLPRRYSEIRDLVREAEAAGVDSIWLSDHLLYRPKDGEPTAPWEAWTMLGALAEATSTVRLGTLVSAVSFRHPGVLAKMAATTQEICDGRLVLGVGAGWHDPEYEAFGLPTDHRVGRFAESLEILARLLRDGHIDAYEGTYFRLTDCPLLPAPEPHRPPPILVAGQGPNTMRLAARWADSWNGAWYGLPDERFATRREALAAACTKAGRDPGTLAQTAGMFVTASDTEADAGAEGGHGLHGIPSDPARLVEAFEAWRDAGVAEVMCWLDPAEVPAIRRFFTAVERFTH